MYSYCEHPTGFSDQNLLDSEIECESNSPTCSSFSEYANHASNESGIICNLKELTTSEPTGQEQH